MPATLTVSQLTQALSDVVHELFGSVRVEGEVGRITFARSGHWYLSLKDEGAVLDAAVFRGTNSRMSWRPREGDKVVATGELSVYAPRGSYSLIVRRLERAGAGDLRARLEQLQRALAAEGLFAPERKRPLPAVPRAVGVVTSPTGAALQDILRVIDERWPGLPVYLAPCLVQGDGAAAQIAAGIRLVEAHGKADVLIVGRGGGSAEDLWAFNEEPVVRAVAACGIPVISAVGHETDTSLCDLAADLRAATPSHAAELAVPERDGLLLLVQELQERMRGAAARQVERKRQRLEAMKLRDPRRRVVEARMRADELDAQLRRAVALRVERGRAAVELQAARARALSPLAVLDRGYAIALHQGRAVRDASTLKAGDPVELRLARGGAELRVERVKAEG
jgi:exodeoxyribonuclease VII large subunit